jgi:hypothetical protein
MITVEIGSERVTIVPRSLQCYMDKVDFIKSRRLSPAQSLAGMLNPKNPEGNQKVTEIAIAACMKMSSVSFEEELQFDMSFEGFYYSIWQGLMGSKTEWKKLQPKQGIDAARQWFDALDDHKKTEVRMALRGIDQRSLAKNSNGLPETTEEAEVSQEISSV